jgi:hypothetical protein
MNPLMQEKALHVVPQCFRDYYKITLEHVLVTEWGFSSKL